MRTTAPLPLCCIFLILSLITHATVCHAEGAPQAASTGGNLNCAGGLKFYQLVSEKVKQLKPGALSKLFAWCRGCGTEEQVDRCHTRILWELTTKGGVRHLRREDKSFVDADLDAVESLTLSLAARGKNKRIKNALFWVIRNKAKTTAGLNHALGLLGKVPEPALYSRFLSFMKREVNSGRLTVNEKQSAQLRKYAEVAGTGSAVSAKNARKFLAWLNEHEGKDTAPVKMFQAELDRELAKAVARGTLEEVRGLLVKGADPRAKRYNIPIVEMAVRRGDEGILKALLNAGARAEDGRRDLLYSALHRKKIAIANVLLESGVEVSPETVLKSIQLGEKQLVRKVLAKSKLDLNQNWKSETPLVAAVKADHLEIVQLLVSKGADVNGGTGQSKTSYQLARSDRVRKYLLSQGAIKIYYEAFLFRLKRRELPLLGVQRDKNGACTVGNKNLLQLLSKTKSKPRRRQPTAVDDECSARRLGQKDSKNEHAAASRAQ